MKKTSLYLVFLFNIFIYGAIIDNTLLSNESYITGEDGVIRMYVNIMGHVKNPGIYLVYDNIDFMSALSMAGGYLQGANLKNITIYNIDGSSQTINLNQILKSEIPFSKAINLNPHDTIYIEQTGVSRFFLTSNLPTIILSLINVAISIRNSN